MAVTGPQGIVGVVVAVSDNYSKVMSLLNRNSKVSSMLKKDNVTGSVEWDGNDPSYLTLKGIPRSAKVVKGDTVLTSNYSAMARSKWQSAMRSQQRALSRLLSEFLSPLFLIF